MYVIVPLILAFLMVASFRYFPVKIAKYIKKKADDKAHYQNVEKLEEDSMYFREIPFENLGDAFWLSYCAGLMENPEDIFYAFLLKWHIDGNVEVYKKHNIYYAQVKKKILYTDTFETKVFKHIFLWGAFKTPVKISRIRFSKSLTLTKLLRISYYNLKAHGYALPNNIYAIDNTGAFTVPDDLKPKLEALIGLKKFLEEFTLIYEKSVEAVHLYEMYLVYAELFGIADKTEEELRRYISPELISFYVNQSKNKEI